ncbi:MAG: hypothetical protein QXR48_00460 [Candidatus Woesearchaeota archaeon]
MKKQGEIINALIPLSIAVVFLVVFLSLYPTVEKKLYAAEEKGACEWAVLLAGIRKAGSLSIAEGVPEGCRASRIVIKPEDLRNKVSYAKKRLKTIKSEELYKDTAPYFRDNPEKRSEEQLVYEFALDSIIADQMVSCWEKVFKGRIPIFDEWWRLYNCKKDGKTEPCSKLEDFATFAVPIYGIWEVVSGKLQAQKAPTNCILCSHITFDPQIVQLVGKTSITSLNEFMSNNPVPHLTKSYMEYIEEGQTVKSALFKMGENNFELSDEGIAILYERINAQQLGDIAGISIGGIKQDANVLKILQYRQDLIVAPQGDCTFLLD